GRPADALPNECAALVIGSHRARIRRLLIVIVAELGAGGGDVRGVCHTERPTADVDRMDAVVAQLAIAPMPKEVPVVRNHVVAIGLSERGALPKVVVELGRWSSLTTVADGWAVLEIRRTGIEHAADGAALHFREHLAVHRIAAALQADLDDAIRVAG